MTDRFLPIHILVIDGELSEVDRVEQVLKEAQFPYQMTVCKSDEASLTRFFRSKVHPSVVLCPFSLQGTNMLKAMIRIRELGCEAPVILLAYDLAEEIAIELLSAGVEDYINRNTMKRLPVAIRKSLQRHEALTELQRSHLRIEASEQAIRNMVRNMPMEVAMFDSDMRYLVISDQWAESMGMHEAEILGRHMYDLSPHLPEKWRKMHALGLAGQTMEHEAESYDYNGETRWLRWKMNPWYKDGKSIGGVVLFVENITEKVRVQAEKQEQDERLNLAIEAGRIGIWTWQCDTAYYEFSESGASICGLPHTRPSFLDLADRTHPSDRTRVANSLQHALVNRTTYAEEYRMIREDGSEVTVQSQGRAFYDEDGTPVKMYGVIIDRTEKAELERRVRDSEQLFRDMAENISEVFWLTDYQANEILYMSPQYEKVFGMSVLSIYEDPKSWSQHIHPDDKPGIVNKFRTEAPKGTFDVEYRIQHPDGRLLWVRDRAFPIRDENGEVLRIAGLSQDITKEKTRQGSTI